MKREDFKYVKDSKGPCVTTAQAAKIKNVTRQAVCLAIHEKRLNASRVGRNWMVFLDDLAKYDESRWARIHSKSRGKYIFNYEKGILDVRKCADLLGVPPQKIYYAIRTGKLKFTKKDDAMVVYADDLATYAKEYLNRNLSYNHVA